MIAHSPDGARNTNVLTGIASAAIQAGHAKIGILKSFAHPMVCKTTGGHDSYAAKYRRHETEVKAELGDVPSVDAAKHLRHPGGAGGHGDDSPVTICTSATTAM
jgi:hypothetical protein